MAHLQLAVVPEAPSAIKPYCGARAVNAMDVHATRLGDDGVLGRPAPAWADVGMASHMRDMCGLVPPTAAWASKGAPEALQPRLDWSSFAFKLGVVATAVAENVACYAAFLETNDPGSTLYNKFEAHYLQTDGLAESLLILSGVNSAYLFVFWTLVVVVRLDIFRVMAAARLALSGACCAVCFILVFFAEGTKVAPFLATVFALLHLEFIVFGFLCTQHVSKLRRWTCWTALIWLGVVLLAWCIIFLVDAVVFMRDPDCAATTNQAMPIKIRGLDEWQCVRWGEMKRIVHNPDPSEPPYQAHCSTSFHAFGKVPDPGEEAPGRRAQLVRCPPHCQSLGLGTKVIGCRVYDAWSSVCSAAVQAGALPTDAGGVVKVVGREPLASGEYSMCDLNGVLSRSAEDPSDAVVDGNVTQPRWAFYFQEATDMDDQDVITLHSWKKASVISRRQPWRSYTADVSWVVSGGELRRQEVQLGPPDEPDPAVQLNFCHPRSSSPLNRCA